MLIVITVNPTILNNKINIINNFDIVFLFILYLVK